VTQRPETTTQPNDPSTAKQSEAHMAQRSDRLTPPTDETVHARTGAKKATTSETAVPPKIAPPSVAQVLA
jgi:hypothetical protein